MNKMRKLILLLIIGLIFFSCNKKEKSEKVAPKSVVAEKTDEQNTNAGWEEIMPSVVKFDSYDGDRILESGQGFFIAERIGAAIAQIIDHQNGRGE